MTATEFFTTTIPLPDNSVKSFIFRLSALALQISVVKLFAFITFHRSAYTSYLILSEPLLQQLVFIFRQGSLLVAAFLVLFTASAFWDTMLWGLDSPGLVQQSYRVTASSLTGHERPAPAYTITSQSATGDLASLDIPTDLAAGIWQDLNVTIVGAVAAGNPLTGTTEKWKTAITLDMSSGSKYPGARIYLDDNGWSVSIDMLKNTVLSNVCNDLNTTAVDLLSWMCTWVYSNNSRASIDYITSPIGTPAHWWSDQAGLLEYETVAPERGTNNWEVLGTGGDTVAMKMVYSLQKGYRRHTFLVSTMKTTILAFATANLTIDSVDDLVKRTWRTGTEGPDIMAADLAIINQTLLTGTTGLTMGRQLSDGYSVISRAYQLVAPLGEGGIPYYTAFQIEDSNITLVDSETVNEVPVPYEACDTWYTNEAYGGKTTATNCYTAERSPGKKGLFEGAVDTMAVWILRGTLGKTRAVTPEDALDQRAWTWLGENDAALNALVMSRAYVLSRGGTGVQVRVGVLRAGVSSLQCVLVGLPVLLLLLSWGVVSRFVEAHFQASLFASLVATTHEGWDPDKPDVMGAPPEVRVVKIAGRTHLGTDTGVFLHTTESPIARAMVVGGGQEVKPRTGEVVYRPVRQFE